MPLVATKTGLGEFSGELRYMPHELDKFSNSKGRGPS